METVTPALLSLVAAYLVFAVVSVWLVVIDLKEHRLPNRIVAFGAGAIFVLLITSSVFAAASQNSQSTGMLLTAVVAGVLYGIVFLILWYFAPTSMGAGDVKLAPLIGLMAGWSGLWVAVLWVPLLIGVIGGVAGLVSRARHRKFFAFGPVMIAACWLGILLAGVGWIR